MADYIKGSRLAPLNALLLVLLAATVITLGLPSSVAHAEPPTSSLTVTSQDTGGAALTKYLAMLNQSGNIVETGYTPATLSLVDGGSYTVTVVGYGACQFDYWSDTGSTQAIRTISITSNAEITAVLNCGGAAAAVTTTATTTTASSTTSSSSSSSSTTSPAQVGSLGPWDPTASPASSGGSEPISCAAYTGYVYCVGTSASNSADAFYAPLTSAGAGTWTNATDYPVGHGNVGIQGTACAASSGYIYCVGGYTQGSGSKAVAAAYFAPISSSGIGTWTSTSAYPAAVGGASCVISGAYMYCVGGAANAVYYAPVSGSGIGAWTVTTDFPTNIRFGSCQALDGYIYCIGGTVGPNLVTQVNQATNAVYYAGLSSNGVGPWSATSSYPLAAYSLSCATSSQSYIYCVGGYGNDAGNSVFYATVSASGISSWVGTSSYPKGVYGEGCVTSGTYLYCFSPRAAGYGSDYASVYLPTSSLTVTAQDTHGDPLTSYTAVLNQSGTVVVATAATPATFGLYDGQGYTVTVDGYGPCRFDYWLDTGNSTAIRELSITGDTQITEVLNCVTSTTSFSSSSSTMTTTMTSTSSSSSIASSTTSSSSSSSQGSSTTTSSSSASSSTTLPISSSTQTTSTGSSSRLTITNSSATSSTSNSSTSTGAGRPALVSLPVIGATGALIMVIMGVAIVWARRL